MYPEYLREHPKGATIKISVQPRAGKTGFAGEKQGQLKMRIAAPPVEGEANAECIRYLAKSLGISKSSLEILSGERGRNKVILVLRMSPEQIWSKLSLLVTS